MWRRQGQHMHLCSPIKPNIQVIKSPCLCRCASPCSLISFPEVSAAGKANSSHNSICFYLSRIIFHQPVTYPGLQLLCFNHCDLTILRCCPVLTVSPLPPPPRANSSVLSSVDADVMASPLSPVCQWSSDSLQFH